LRVTNDEEVATNRRSEIARFPGAEIQRSLKAISAGGSVCETRID